MKDNNHGVGIFATCFVLVIVLGAWYHLFGYSFVPNLFQRDKSSVQAEQRILDISNIDEAYDAILNKSTKEFIGYHAVDESFLSWFTSLYGVEALENIAAYATLDNADVWYQITGSSMHVLWYRYCQSMDLQDYAFTKTIEKPTKSSYDTVIDFTGDFSLAEGVGTTDYFNSVGGDLTKCLDYSLLSELRDADVLVVNNEFVYSTGGEPIPNKDYHFKADPSTWKALQVMGTDVAGLANNHVYDFGEVGLLDTLQTLEDNKMPYIGAGRNLNEAAEPVYFIANGKKIAIVAATQIERSTNYTKEATETTPGVLKTLHPERYVAEIAKAKKNADYVICFVHWGTEGSSNYQGDQELLAKAFVAAGADAIIGGHTHCLQGADVLDGVPIFYSLGNFYFSQEPEMPSPYDTGVAQIIIQSDGTINARFLPCHFSEGKLKLLEPGKDYQRVIEFFGQYSGRVKLDVDGYLVAK